MEVAWPLAVLLLAASSAVVMGAGPVTSDCILEPVGKDQSVKVLYTTSRVASGCISRGPAEAGQEVHVLFVNFSNQVKVPRVQFSVNMTELKGNRETIFVVNSNTPFYEVSMDCQQKLCQLTIISTRTLNLLAGPNIKRNTTNLPLSGRELLSWAKATFGRVSSFAELENPQWIHFQVGRETSTAENCIPEKNFNAEQYLEAEILSHNTESFLRSDRRSQKEAHIVWLQDNSTLTVDLNFKAPCSTGGSAQQLLIIKSHDGLVWNLKEMPAFGNLMISGKYKMKIFPNNLINGSVMPDTKEELIQVACNNSAFIASYTEIPSAKSITLESVRTCGEPRITTTAETQSKQKGMTSIIQTLINNRKSWQCFPSGITVALLKNDQHVPDIITEVTLQDPSCKATENKTHLVLQSQLEGCLTQLEGDTFAHNELVVTLSMQQEKVKVPFKCAIQEKVSLQLYRTPDFRVPSTTVEVNKATYVQVSVWTMDQKALLAIDQCFLNTPEKDSLPLQTQSLLPRYSAGPVNVASPKIYRSSFTYKAKEPQASLLSTLTCKVTLGNSSHHRTYNSSLEVLLKYENASSPNQGLSIGTVLGITFGAFLIGVLLTATLWYIYSHTRPMAKMQPVSANPPASESSSTNHSIGSTQSTPCSTSSMA
ncbi:Endoglin [Varanus komodoensis]|uniref:Endoglin n=1 Tax=Varanus komodoensis TaxID=61221 RepID=A0A8D2LTY8_VARKO|nr:endoglin isoform X2 [Varanus komodoensis]KAF7241040.1 Endoglin [Varanus komodoensis]